MIRRLFLLATSVIVAQACNGPNSPSPHQIGLAISGPASVAPLAAAQLTALAVFSDNSRKPATDPVTWSVADSSIALMLPSSGSIGLVRGLVLGSTTIRVTSGAFSAQAPIQVALPYAGQVGPYTISGVVAADNGQPIANASVNGWVQTGDSGYSYWYAHGPLHSDASGGYRLVGLPTGATVWVEVNATGYVQQCAAWAIVTGDLTLNAPIVSTANVTASPGPLAPGLRSISGTVVEMTAAGSQPVSGAFVVAEAGSVPDFAPSELAGAYTYTDAAGRFALCGLPSDGTVYLEADGVGNASAQVSVGPGQTSGVLITLPSSMSSMGSTRLRIPKARSGGGWRH